MSEKPEIAKASNIDEVLEKGEKATVIFQSEDGKRNITFSVAFLANGQVDEGGQGGEMISKMEVNPPVSIEKIDEAEAHFQLYGKLAMMFNESILN